MNPQRIVLLAVAVSTVVVVGACSKKSPERTAPVQLVSDLAVFATGEAPDEASLATTSQALASGSLTMERYVDGLLKQKMGARLAKDLVVSPSDTLKDRHPIAVHSVLKKSKVDGATIYHLRGKCSASEAVSVKPWWSDDDVMICKDSYRPEVKGDAHGRTCGSSLLAPKDSECGCGPRLIYCARDNDHYKDIQEAILDELVQTSGYVVNEDKPIEELFTMNGSVRGRMGEFVYRRARIAAGEPETLVPVVDFDKKASLQPRYEQVPGQQAGVLSMPIMTYASDALRGVMRNYSEYLWCAGVASSRVTTESVMALKVVDLRVGDGWRQLASMEVCTDCHARLDYGMQFFWGYPSSTMGVDFRPKDVIAGKGKLYMNDIDDERGEDDLTPAGFARLAVAQPEFGKCMTRKVVDHVFNGTETAADYKAVLDSFKGTHRIKSMLRVAMTRYAERVMAGAPPAPPKKPASSPAATSHADGALVTITPELREGLDAHCANCHDKGDYFDFSAKALPREKFMLMMDQVGFGAMPMDPVGLDEDERVAFLQAVAPLAFPDDSERAVALRYFTTGMRAHPVHRFRSAMMNVNVAAKGDSKGFRPGSIETAVSQNQMAFTPGMAMSSAVTAMKACHEKKLAGEELEACVSRGSAPSTIIVGALGAK